MSLQGKLAKIGLLNSNGQFVAAPDFAVTDDLTVTDDVSVGGDLTVTGGLRLTPVAVPDATPYTVLAANSGKLHILPDLTADTTINMPTAAAGLHYIFVIGVAEDTTQDAIFDTGADANYFHGALVCIDDDDSAVSFVASDNDSNSIMSILTPGAGTRVEMWCDGTKWYVTGQVIGGTATSVTFADQS
jgi:hypothetical protein